MSIHDISKATSPEDLKKDLLGAPAGETEPLPTADTLATPAGETAVTAPRDLNTITTEILTIHRQTEQTVVNNAIEIGRRLVEAKAMVPHGEWGEYIKTRLGYSQSTANNFMRLFEELGDAQIGLLGAEAKSQTFGNLTYTKALAMLALPAEEREEFVESHNVGEMSTRELQEAIKERDVANARLEGAQKELQEAQEASWNLTKKLDKAEEREAKLKEQVKQANAAAEKAAQDLAEAKDALEALKAQPIDVAVEQPNPAEVDRLAEEKVAVAQKAHEKRVAELEQKLAAAETTAKEAEEALKNAQAGADELKAKAEATAQAEVDELKKKLAVAAPEVAQFAVHFEAVQREFNDMMATVGTLREQGNDKADSLTAAVKAFLTQALEQVEE